MNGQFIRRKANFCSTHTPQKSLKNCDNWELRVTVSAGRDDCSALLKDGQRSNQSQVFR
jgi:hypothetical protein